MIRSILVATMLAAVATPAATEEILFADRAVAWIRQTHPEFRGNPIYVTCRGPERTTEFRGEPEVYPASEVVYRVLVDNRCDYPWSSALGAAR